MSKARAILDLRLYAYGGYPFREEQFGLRLSKLELLIIALHEAAHKDARVWFISYYHLWK